MNAACCAAGGRTAIFPLRWPPVCHVPIAHNFNIAATQHVLLIEKSPVQPTEAVDSHGVTELLSLHICNFKITKALPPKGGVGGE